MRHRLGLTGVAFVAVLTAMFGLVPWVFMIVAIPLVIVWVGMPMLAGAAAAQRWFIRPWRRAAGWVRDEPIVVPYVAFPGGGLVARARWLFTDRATWRELWWVLVNVTAGFVLALVPVALFAGGLFWMLWPMFAVLDADGVGAAQGATNPISIAWHAMGWWPLGWAFIAAWFFTTPPLMRAWAAIHARLLGPSEADVLSGRVAALTASRADTVDAAAREVRRIERDLHDGVQVHLVSLGMSLGMAEELIESDPARAGALLREARAATTETLQDLRRLVRGIHPPLLADRGLIGAVRTLALDMPLEVDVEVTGMADDDRLEAPVEACGYFAVAEVLTNAVKHADPDRVLIAIDHHADRLTLAVRDDGHGGARLGREGGLAGVARRLAAFDGDLVVDSPPGGPTELIMEIPCTLLSQAPPLRRTGSGPSSPKITRSSAKA